MHTSPKVLIGWKESVDLPKWGVKHLIAKADTGARRSCMDATKIEQVDEEHVEFNLMLHRIDRSQFIRVRSKIGHIAHVKSSNGDKSERFFVKTIIRIGKMEEVTEFSLMDREGMTCRMLLGRKTLEDHFLVDAAQKYVIRKRGRTSVRHQTQVQTEA
jgi:hypothetical protein